MIMYNTVRNETKFWRSVAGYFLVNGKRNEHIEDEVVIFNLKL